MENNYFYKILFRFFNLIGVLNLNFNGQIFKISKFRTTLFFISILLSIIIRFYKLVEALFLQPDDKNVSKFSSNYLSILASFNVLSTTFWIECLILNQIKIAKIFNFFLDLKIFCEFRNLKINRVKLLKMVRNSLLLFNFISFSFIFMFIFSFFYKRETSNFISFVYYFFIELPSIIHPLQFSSFVHLTLIHYEFLLESFNQILIKQFELVHNDCEFLLEKVVKIHELFNLLDQAFDVVFTVSTFKQFLNVSAVVSFLIYYILTKYLKYFLNFFRHFL